MGSHAVDPSLLGLPSSERVDADFSENDEVDQLDSDSEMGDSGADADSEREWRDPGRSLLPATRLENIIQADGM
jgi:hypothetical protein